MYCKQPQPSYSILTCVAGLLVYSDIQDIHYLSISAGKHNGRHADRRLWQDRTYHPCAQDRLDMTVTLQLQVW